MKINKLFLLFVLLVITSTSLVLGTAKNVVPNNEKNLLNLRPKAAGIWDLTGSPIDINNNWSSTQSTYPWCTGAGTINNPYVIENITIDGLQKSSCITIKNTNDYFIIQNCTLYNSSTGADEAGIFLSSVDNGQLIENNISNNYHGIFLKSSDNNLVSMNTIGDNDGNGVYLFSTVNNTILNNNITSNYQNGIFCDRVNRRNRIEHNNIMYNYHGINFDREYGDCEYNEILFNTISENRMYGITFVNFRQFYYGNITGNFITYNLGNGIYIKGGVHNTHFINNTISHNQEIGINLDYWSLRGCDNNIIERNTINNHSNYGIRSYQGHNNEIIHNNFNDNEIGVWLARSDNNLIAKNTIINGSCAFYNAQNYWCNYTENKMINCGFFFTAGHDWDITTRIDSNNLVNGKSLYFYVGQSNLGAINFSNAGQIILYDCNSSLITDLNLTRGTMGVFLLNCFNITISNTNLSNNRVWGLLLSSSNNNTIMKNIINNINGNANPPIFGASTGGIKFNSGDHNKIFENEITRNSNYGVYVGSSSQKNVIYLNNFTENLKNVKNYGVINQWDNGSVGNYWSDYGGKDINDNGIGDSSYNIDEYGNDNFPIYWDAPLIQINSPNTNESFEKNPSFTISVVEGIADTIWYSLDSGITNITIAGMTGVINDTEWFGFSNGPIDIRFYANDSKGYISNSHVQITKVSNPPDLEFTSPTLNQVFDESPPTFSITISDVSPVVARWYTIDNGINYYNFTGGTGVIDTVAWKNIPEGEVTLICYAMDNLGNIGNESITIIKELEPETLIPSYNIYLTIGITTIISLVLTKKQRKR